MVSCIRGRYGTGMREESVKSEEDIEAATLATKETYLVGDLLWSRIGRNPYWPCMVSYDPKEGCYMKTRKVRDQERKIYHVQYFGGRAQHGWTNPSSILPFEGMSKYSNYTHNLFRVLNSDVERRAWREVYRIKRSIRPKWTVAVLEAELALSFDATKRYKSFVFKYEEKANLKVKDVSRKRKHKRLTNQKNGTKAVKKLRMMSAAQEDICKICEEGNIDLTCTGDCSLSYHKDCLGLYKLPSEFICSDCENGLFCCYACKKKDSSVRQCSKCIYHYHVECLSKLEGANLKKNICPLHVCLTCHKEHPRKISNKDLGPPMQCIRCPTMFHASKACLPVGLVKLTPSLIICPNHFLGKNKGSSNPVCNVIYCSKCSEGGELVCCESCPNAFHSTCLDGGVPAGDFICSDCNKKTFLYEGMVLWTKTGHFRWWPAQIVSEDTLPNNEHCDGEFLVQYFGSEEYYWTHKGRIIPYAAHHREVSNPRSKPCKINSQYNKSLQEASKAYDNYLLKQQLLKPNFTKPEYKHIKVNRYVPPATVLTDASNLSPCLCNPQSSNPCGPGSYCINRAVFVECNPSLCLAGDRCQNQRLQRRQYPSLKIIKTQDRGWGLKTLQFISEGTFVIEYVGEIITHEEYRNRNMQMQKENNKNSYFLYLDSKRMLDAGPKGNLGRFINHSCSPNCEMKKWSVNDDLRVGIFAKTDIQPEEELTFNYQPDNLDFGQCLCKSSNCKGFVGKCDPKEVKKKSNEK